MHYIEIEKQHQSKGFGGTALDLTIAVAQELSKQSTFYDRLSLQCSEYDGDKFIGFSPYRLSYYLNHGFTIDPKTLSYMRYLELARFVRALSVKKFKYFLNYYDQENHERSNAELNMDVHNYPLKSYEPHAEIILGRLQEQYQQTTPLSDDEIIQIAESNSSIAAKCALDRLFFDPSISKEENDKSGFYMYLLHLDVKKWDEALKQRQELTNERKKLESRTFNPNEFNDLLDHIYRIYWQFIGNIFTETSNVTSCIDPEDNQSVKMRKVGSSDDATSTSPTVSALPL